METKENIYNHIEYKRSRKAYIGQCAFDYLITILVSDVFLATLLTSIGISDAVTGIISSFVSVAFLFQLLSIFLISKIKNVKRTVMIFDCISQFLFMLLYIIPFLKIVFEMKVILAVAFIFFAYAFKYLVSGILFKWANSFVEQTNRAEYSAKKEIVSLVSGIFFTFIMGYVVDKFTMLDNVEGGFVFITAVLLVLNICNFVSLKLIKKKNKTETVENIEEKEDFFAIIRGLFQKKEFKRILCLTILFDISRYMTIGFMGTFKVKDLLMTVGMVQIINIIGNIARIFVSVPFGKISDKKSYAVGMRYALMILAAAFFVNIFTTNKTWWLIIVHTILFNVSIAGTNQNSFNILYDYVDVNYFVQAMAIKNSIGGICGFLTTLVASKILEFVQANGNSVIGINIYGQQLLSLISFIIVVLTIMYTYFVVERQPIKKQ